MLKTLAVPIQLLVDNDSTHTLLRSQPINVNKQKQKFFENNLTFEKRKSKIGNVEISKPKGRVMGLEFKTKLCNTDCILASTGNGAPLHWSISMNGGPDTVTLAKVVPLF